MAQIDFLHEFLAEWNAKQGIHARTSGSTGEPKDILLPHSLIKRSAMRTIRHFGIRKGDRLHSAISFEFIGGKMMIARSLEAGCALTFSEPSLEPEIPQPCGKIKLMSVVPAQMPHILSHLSDFSMVENFLIGGSKIDNRLWDKIVETGINAWESYGMTETASHIALRRVSGSSTKRPRFVTLRGIDVKTDEESRLHIRDGDMFFPTNDIARIAPDSSFEIIGRFDNVVITGGRKVIPEQIEQILYDYIGNCCKDFFITSVDDEKWSSRLVLICVPKEPLTESEKLNKIEELKAKISAVPEEILPRWKRPKEIRPVDSIPLSASGKILRRIP